MPSTTTGTSSTTPTTPAITACEASGKGTDYQVGPGKTYTTLDAVPWEALKAGDTVRIFYSSTPYKGKFLLAAPGTTDAPVRICGVRGPNNERPIIEGSGATTRSALLSAYGNTAETQDIHQTRSVIVVKALASGTYTDYPTWIQIDGLNIRIIDPQRHLTGTFALQPDNSLRGTILVKRAGRPVAAKIELEK